jgi:hypothetical protein
MRLTAFRQLSSLALLCHYLAEMTLGALSDLCRVRGRLRLLRRGRYL